MMASLSGTIFSSCTYPTLAEAIIDMIVTYPVFSCTPHEGVLTPAC